MERPPLAVAIHNLNSRGGHERSTREILRHLRSAFAISAFTYEFEDKGTSEFSGIRVERLRPEPGIDALKVLYFLGASIWHFVLRPRLGKRRRPFILSTGTASAVSDAVQVQFVHRRWFHVRAQVDKDLCDLPGARGRNPAGALCFRVYQYALLCFHVLIEFLVYRPGKRYIAISESVKRELQAEFGLRDIVVIRHGVDAAVFRPVEEADGEVRRGIRRDLGLGPEEVGILFVGAYERKGLAAAIDGFARLPTELQCQARLVAVGSGASAGFRARAAAQGIADRLVCAPNRRDIPDVYRAMDIFLMPTLYEPFGLVILEAMASGLATVVSLGAGAAELILDGRNGRLIRDPADPLEIRDALAPLIADPKARLKLGRAARATALERSWETVAEEYAKALRPLILHRGDP